MQNFICSLKEIKTCYRKSEKSWWADHPLCSRVKQSLTKASFRIWLICANQLLLVMRVNCITTQCVNLYQEHFTRVGILIRRPAGLYHDNKTCGFENMVKSYFQRTRPECKIESFHTKGRQKEIACFSVDGFCCHCNTVFEAMGCFYHFCHCRKLRPSLIEEDI